MIGTTVESRPTFSWGALLCFLLAAVAAALAPVTGMWGWALFSLMPLLCAAALWLAKPTSFRAEFTNHAMVVEATQTEVFYDAIEGVKGKGRKDNPNLAGPGSYPIQVLHRGGMVEIPAPLDVPSDNVFQFLYSHLTPSGSRAVNARLQPHLDAQIKLFGPEKVFSYAARAHPGRRFSLRKPKAFFLGTLLAAIVWGVVGFTMPHSEAWGVAGVVVAILSVFLLLAFFAESKDRSVKIKNWRQASLIIGPKGLALVQGDDIGEMRWDELKAINPMNKGQLISSGEQATFQGEGIRLEVQGASFIIGDIYDRPLHIIIERMKHYWR